MVATASSMLELGSLAPPFSLPNVDGKLVASSDFAEAPALLVMFICNHCPYVIHVRSELVAVARNYQPRGVAVVAINSNDVESHPEDRPERMREEAARYGYGFPYLFDQTQEVAKAYRAACTPDFYLFDAKGRLFYRGQLDDSRPKNDIPVTGRDLRRALDDLLAARPCSVDQKPSIGCNIKWRAGNEPDYFGS